VDLHPSGSVGKKNSARSLRPLRPLRLGGYVLWRRLNRRVAEFAEVAQRKSFFPTAPSGTPRLPRSSNAKDPTRGQAPLPNLEGFTVLLIIERSLLSSFSGVFVGRRRVRCG
jgi:hypothetical protein